MPRICSSCMHPQREAIDKALVAGTPLPRITALYRETSEDALFRHKAAHLPAMLAQAQQDRQRAHAADLAGQATAQEEQERVHAIDIAKQLKAINAAALRVLNEALGIGDRDVALRAIDRVHRQLELQAKLLGELDERPQVNVLVSSEWQNVRATLLAALGPYPEARVAVAAQLMALESPNGHR
jgi:hypothetical protein